LVQTIGRAARNIDGKVILYADVITKSIKAALEETKYRKNKQIEFNKKNNITPQSVKRNIGEIIESIYEKDSYTVGTSEIDKLILINLKTQKNIPLLVISKFLVMKLQLWTVLQLLFAKIIISQLWYLIYSKKVTSLKLLQGSL